MRQLKSAVNVLICSKSFFINYLPSLHWMRLDFGAGTTSASQTTVVIFNMVDHLRGAMALL